MIRKAVGAIIFRGDKYLLVHKIKIKDAKGDPEATEGAWDFCKGGMLADEVPEIAIRRELLEETGSENYKIVKQLEEPITFTFPKKLQEKLGVESQKTIMFLVEYLGDGQDLKPADEEIDKLCFFSEKEVMEKIPFVETKEFFRKVTKKKNLKESRTNE